jgi:hypothetical protein
MAQFRDALWHSESHAPVAERSIDPLGVGSAPYEVPVRESSPGG